MAEPTSGDLIAEARTLCEGGDPQFGKRVILQAWIELLVDGHVAETDTLLAQLPDPLSDDAEVLAVRACCARLRDDREGARLLHARSRARRSDGSESPFYALFLEDDEQRLYGAVQRALAAIESGAPRGRSHAYAVYLVGWTLLRLRRDPVIAHQLLEAARADAEARRLDVLASRASLNRAFALAFAGRFTDALRLTESTPHQEQGAWRRYDGGIEGVTTGYVAYWRGDLEYAQTAFAAVLADEGEAPYAHLARVYLAFVGAVVGGSDARATAHRELQRVPDHTLLGVPWRVWRATAECQLARALGRKEAAVRLARGIVTAEAVPVARVIAADALRWSGDHRAAHDALEAHDPRRHPAYLTAYVELIRALIAHEAGLENAAHVRLERALDAAAPEQAYLPFLLDSAGAAELLSTHSTWGTRHEVAVAACLARRVSILALQDTALSPREQQILTYLRTNLSAAEIAEALHVSVNTVKTHQRAIYRKLGVAGRREAVRYRL